MGVVDGGGLSTVVVHLVWMKVPLLLVFEVMTLL